MALCEECGKTKCYAPVATDNGGLPYESEGTTLYTGSVSSEACVPKKSQMSPEAGQAFFTAATATAITRNIVTGANTIAACIAACPTPANVNCIVQFNASAAPDPGCVVATLAAASSAPSDTAPQFVYKLPPVGVVGASSVPQVAGKMMSSGHYAHGTIAAATHADWLTVGTNLTADARMFSAAATAVSITRKMKECKKICDDSNVCIGFVAEPAATAGDFNCYFRGGVDALNTRAFFAIPDGDITAPLMW